MGRKSKDLADQKTGIEGGSSASCDRNPTKRKQGAATFWRLKKNNAMKYGGGNPGDHKPDRNSLICGGTPLSEESLSREKAVVLELD